VPKADVTDSKEGAGCTVKLTGKTIVLTGKLETMTPDAVRFSRG
jgi:NAD-dependent DNA ligase